MKKIIRASNFIESASSTVTNFLDGKVLRVVTVETEKAEYVGNDLTSALNTWKESGDDSIVVQVSSCG